MASGADICVPDLRMCHAADCRRVLKPIGNHLCGVHYPELAKPI
jgi:hypothetical protein